MGNIPILIIEENKSHSKLDKLALAEGPYDIRTANDADEAMQIITEFQPQLILMGRKLPGIDGLELTRKLKADPRYHDIIIIGVSAYGMKGDKEAALNAGCDGYIVKPIDIDIFPKTIADFLAQANKKLSN